MNKNILLNKKNICLFIKEMHFNCTQQSNNSLLQRINPQAGFIGQLPPLNITQNKKLIDQMSNSVCRVVIESKVGTGFLCLIPFPTIEYRLKVLITCNHVINGNEKEIKLIFNDSLERTLKLNNTRKIYTNNLLTKLSKYDP